MISHGLWNVSGQRIHVSFSITKTILWEYPISSHMKISSFVLVQGPRHSFSSIVAIHGIHAWLPPYPHLWETPRMVSRRCRLLGSELLQQLTLSDFLESYFTMKDTDTFVDFTVVFHHERYVWNTVSFFSRKNLSWDSLCRAHCCSKTENLIHFGHFRISHTVVDSSN